MARTLLFVSRSVAVVAACVAGMLCWPLAATAAASTITPEWVVASSAMNRLSAYLGNSTLTTNAFDTSTTLDNGVVPNGWVVQPADIFDAYGPATTSGSFLYALANHAIPAGTTYVGYDDESWSFTPSNEQQDPATYMADFVATAHSNGYKAVLLPGVDLTNVMPCYVSTDPAWQNYLTVCDLPAMVGKAAPDVYEIQSQRFENDTASGSSCGCYEWFTAQAAAEASAVTAIPEIVGGLSTDPAGNTTTAQTLYTDTLNTLGTVAGYSLNIPVQSASCPTCTLTGNPDVAANYLWMLGYTGQGSQTITFTSTAPSPAVYAGPTYTVTATGGPSGNPVTFSSGTPATCTVSGATVGFVGAGTCVVDANQAGSANWTAAPQATQSITVAPASQAIAFAAPASGAVGTSATLSASGGGSGNPVTFSVDPSSGAGVCSVSGPNGSQVGYGAVGSCVIDANQAGNANWSPAPQVSQTISVGPGSQAITYTGPAAGMFGGTGTLTATGGGSGNPVTFTLDASSGAGVCSLSGANGSQVSYTGLGSCVVDANEAGNANWLAAAQVTATIAVSAASQTISFTSTPPPGATYSGPTYTVTATGGGSGNPVTFSSATPAVCAVAGSTVSFVGAGTCTVAADQAGNVDYTAAAEVTQSFAVAGAPQVITFTSTPPPGATYSGPTYTVTATGGGSGNPVTFSSATPAVCAVAGSTVSFVGVGTCTVDADQAGNADYAAATEMAQSFAVGQAAQAITFTSTPPASATYAGPAYTVTATGGGSGNPVTFSSGSPAVCTVTGATVAFVGVGTCTVHADQAGSVDYAAATEMAQSFAVGQAAQAITFTSAPPTGATYAGPTYTVKATGGGSGNPVTFSSGTPTVCTVSGATVSFVGVGTCTVDADQAGSVDYTAAPQVSESFAVGKAAQTITFTSKPPTAPKVGSTYTVTATGGGSGNPVTFSTSTPTACKVSGATVTFLAATTCTVLANQAGNADYLAAPQASQSIKVKAH